MLWEVKQETEQRWRWGEVAESWMGFSCGTHPWPADREARDPQAAYVQGCCVEWVEKPDRRGCGPGPFCGKGAGRG